MFQSPPILSSSTTRCQPLLSKLRVTTLFSISVFHLRRVGILIFVAQISVWSNIDIHLSRLQMTFYHFEMLDTNVRMRGMKWHSCLRMDRTLQWISLSFPKSYSLKINLKILWTHQHQVFIFISPSRLEKPVYQRKRTAIKLTKNTPTKKSNCDHGLP